MTTHELRNRNASIDQSNEHTYPGHLKIAQQKHTTKNFDGPPNHISLSTTFESRQGNWTIIFDNHRIKNSKQTCRGSSYISTFIIPTVSN